MTMGLILLAVMAIALFLISGRRSFTSMGVPAWIAFIAIAALAIGIIVPSISVGTEFTMSVGGFIVPSIIMFALLAVLIVRGGVLRGVASMLAVTAVTTALLLIMPTYNTGYEILTVFVVGLVAGAVAYMVSRTPSASLFGVVGGLVLGNVIVTMMEYFTGNMAVFMLGQSVIYNAIFVGIIFAFCLAEIAVMAVKMMGEENRHSRRSSSFEAGEDSSFDRDDNDDYDLFR